MDECGGRLSPFGFRYADFVTKSRSIGLLGRLAVALVCGGVLACGGGASRPAANSLAPADLPAMPELSSLPLDDEAGKQLDVYLERLEGSPNEGGLNGETGMLLHSQGRIEEAEVMYRRARMLVPTSARWAYLHGVTLEELNRGLDAMEAFKEALSRNDKDAPTMLRLAKLYRKLGEESENESSSEDGRNLLTRLLVEYPESAAAHYEMAKLTAAEGETETAVNHYEQALEHGDSFGAGHAEVAELYARLGESRLAERHRALAVKRAGAEQRFQDRWMSEVQALAVPDWDYARKGEELIRLGRLRQAAQALQKAVAEDPDDAESRVNLTAIYGLLGEPLEARRHYRELISRNPNHARAHLNMGTLALGAQQWDAAIGYYNKAVAADPFTLKAYIGLSRAYLAKDNPGESLRQLELAVRRNRYFTATLTELGERLAEAGRYDEAIERLEQAVLYAEVQERLPVMRKLAATYDEAGDRDKAIETLEEAREEARRREDNVTAVLIRSQLREYGAL